MDQKETKHERRATFVTTRFEKWALPRMASALPHWVLPDHLTALGSLSAVLIALFYVLANHTSQWIWAVNGAIVLHWIGDSLDGTLARVRKIERPRYGYYLDHLVDAFSTVIIGLGLGLSPFMLLSVALAIVVAYLVLSINVYLETYVFGKFRYGYGIVGPTEVRLLLIALNVIAIIARGFPFEFLGIGLTVFDILGMAAALGMAGMLIRRVRRNLLELSRLEPPNTRRNDES